MRQWVSFIAVSAFAFSLTACVDGTTSPTTSGPVAPSSKSVDLTGAVTLFQSVCLDGAASPAKAKAAIDGLPMRQHPETGTYYHNSLNLSFKLIQDDGVSTCSMVFASRDPAGQLAIAFSAAAQSDSSIKVDVASGYAEANGPKGTKFTFRPVPISGDVPLYNARLTSGK
ncbi:hypothetical protein [Celeribacter sp. PS-C1]|uniref:hypothetical protein n=1 Tax=Celeribacter sp. PS-C1 TaxID=2820813 RepID=UPI001CA4862D|nr:hypothetical protein [Celeribacter sp. PS-C1]MBW6418993.1 hypothetical protein [Celeribacter sp. PS-C1]